MHKKHYSYWQAIWRQYKHHRLGLFALGIVIIFCLVGVYAPFLASSKPLVVQYEGTWYFPLFRYLFFSGFYSKYLDIFYNLLIFTLPLFVASWMLFKSKKRRLAMMAIALFQIGMFSYLVIRVPDDPAANPALNIKRQEELQKYLAAQRLNPLFTPPLLPNWERELTFLTPYAKLNLILQYQQWQNQDRRLNVYQEAYAQGALAKGKKDLAIPSLWHFNQLREQQALDDQKRVVESLEKSYLKNQALWNQFFDKCQSDCEKAINQLPIKEKEGLIKAKAQINQYEKAKAQIKYSQDRRNWLEAQVKKLRFEIMPLIRPYHWEDDVGGEQDLNQYISWWELTRINRKDMVAALIFGIRISLSVGLLAIGLALLIGVPLGAIAGYYGGKVDILLYRLIEIWESMPTFFMLLMVVAFLQSKSIFLVIGIIGLFGWTNFSRFIRGEFFKQKQLPYVEACHALGFSNSRIMFIHLLPNAIPPLLTLIPFAVMGAITSEAGLSFLGLGEEGSSSWGVLMDEGRSAFPSESYLLWPPAILLTILLVSIAIVGDTMRDVLDPKMHAAGQI